MNKDNLEQTEKDFQKDEKTSQIYDKIFKRILTLSNVAVVNFINGIFNKDFPLGSTLTYHWTENIKNNLEKTISDTIITVNDKEKFHIEVQINSDSTIAIRVFDYGYQDALKYKKSESNRIILEFPQSKVLLLEHSSASSDTIILELKFGKQGSFQYEIPIMKLLEHTIEQLNQQHMVILLPLYLLKLRKEIEKDPSRKNALKLKILINDGIIKSIEDNQKAGTISSEDSIVLIGLLGKLYAHLFGSIKKFKEEGVNDMITEKLILDTDALMHENKKLILDTDALKSENEKLILETDVLKIECEQREELGKEIKALEIAKSLLDDGMAVEQVIKITKLPLNKITELQA